MKANGKTPYGYDHVDGQFVPHHPTLDGLEKAISQIRDNGASIRSAATWLEKETGRRLSPTRLYALTWTYEEIGERQKARNKGLTPAQKKKNKLKMSEKQIRIKHGIAKRKLERFDKSTEDKAEPELKEFEGGDEVEEVKEDDREVIFRPNPGPQTAFLAAAEREVFYGGARGGGKTYSLLIAPLRFVHHPTSRALLIRRSMGELRDVIFQTQQLYPKIVKGAKFKAQENTWIFPNGARIEFGYCENVTDVLRYQGQSYSWIGVDELPQYSTPDIWYFLRSSLRTTDPELPVQMRATGNPGNVGSAWVKKLFIDPAPSGTTVVRDVQWELDGETHTSQTTSKFIAASVYDNPYLTRDDSYVSMLASLPDVKRRQFLYGDWETVEDGSFPEFSKDVHVTEPFEIPNGWTKIRGADYGYSSPSGVVWGAVDYDGVLWIYRELYVTGVTADKLGEMIMDLEEDDGRIYDSVLDSSCWARRGDTSPSLAELINRAGCRFRPSDRSPGSRVAGKVEIHKRLSVDEETDMPGLMIFSTCRNLISQLPALPVSPSNAEDVDTKSEDHLYDALRYLVMSRPTNVRTAYDRAPSTRYRPSDSKFGY